MYTGKFNLVKKKKASVYRRQVSVTSRNCLFDTLDCQDGNS